MIRGESMTDTKGSASGIGIPRIISVDDHLVEPPHMFQERLPQKYKDIGPRIVIAPQGDLKLDNGRWIETPGTGDKMAAWWHYEDHRYQLKEMIACAGMAPEDVSMQGVTYDDIRTACYEPKARAQDGRNAQEARDRLESRSRVGTVVVLVSRPSCKNCGK